MEEQHNSNLMMYICVHIKTLKPVHNGNYTKRSTTQSYDTRIQYTLVECL